MFSLPGAFRSQLRESGHWVQLKQQCLLGLAFLAVSAERERVLSLSQVRSPVSFATLAVSPAVQVLSTASLSFTVLAVSPGRESTLSLLGAFSSQLRDCGQGGPYFLFWIHQCLLGYTASGWQRTLSVCAP